ncbi:hypothetical protein GYA54_01775 [Candidatus Kuenenbacteria bacterium]|nr:hypothetical protein [Candidatus Kuenenbacteria bacterium]
MATNKKFIFAFCMLALAGVWGWPLTTNAAYNDATLEAGTVLYMTEVAAQAGGTPGINIIVSASSEVASIQVNGNNLVIEMEAGSKIYLSSADRKMFNSNLSGTACGSSISEFSYSALKTETLTITFADGDNCVTGGGGGGQYWSGSGSGTAVTDTTAPIISEVDLIVGDTEATINWQTNEPSATWVVYGTSTAYGWEEKTTVYKTTHSLTLTNLAPLTTYYYQIKAQDGSGNTSTYADQQLTTLNSGEVPVTSSEPDQATTDNSSGAINGRADDGLSGISADMKLAKKLAGRLLLRVEKSGEIWYVDTKEYKRYEVKFANALYVFQKLALGVSNVNLEKIPVSGSKESGDVSLRNKLKGKLLLAVEDHGRIWYVDKDGYRHEATWKNLMDLFRELSLGITDANLAKIPAGSL